MSYAIIYAIVSLVLFTGFCITMRFVSPETRREIMYDDDTVQKAFLICWCWGVILPGLGLMFAIIGISEGCKWLLRKVYELLSGAKAP